MSGTAAFKVLRTRIEKKYRDRLEQWSVEYVFPGILAVAAIIAGVVLLIFVDGVVWTGWAAISWGGVHPPAFAPDVAK